MGTLRKPHYDNSNTTNHNPAAADIFAAVEHGDIEEPPSIEPLIHHAGLNVPEQEKMAMEKQAAKHGLGVITAAIFLAGEMAGSGVLALPAAMVGTGKALHL